MELLLLRSLWRQLHAIIVDRRRIFDQCPTLASHFPGGSMATVLGSTAERKSAERKFYSYMALFLVAVVFIGFAPSFYLRGVVPAYPRPNPTLPPGVMFHGLMFTLWMALLVVQTQLVST